MNKSTLLKITILSLSLLNLTPNAISVALADITKSFPDTNPSTIAMILTLPSLFAILFSSISGRLSTVMSKKLLVLIGLVLFIVGGIAPAMILSDSLIFILIMRAILGVGLGICIPFTTGLIADFFESEEQNSLLGFQSSVVNIGGIVTSIIAGVLAALSWSNAFWVYAIGIIVFLLILFKLPEPKRVVVEDTQKKSLGRVVYFICFIGFLFAALTFPMFANTALLIVKQNFGNAASVGIILTFFSIAGLVAGLIFGKVIGAFNRFTGVFGTIFAGAGFLVISYASSLNMVIVGAILTGFGYSTILPLLFVSVIKKTDRSQTTFAIGILVSCFFLGQFVSPLILINITRVLGNTTDMFTFLLCGVILLASSFIMFLFNLKRPGTPVASNN